MSQPTFQPAPEQVEEFAIPLWLQMPIRRLPRYCAKCGCQMFEDTTGEHACEFCPTAIVLPLVPAAPYIVAA